MEGFYTLEPYPSPEHRLSRLGQPRISAFLFPKLSCKNTYGYCESGSWHFFPEGESCVYEHWVTFADSADIHDHDSTTYSVCAKYHYPTRTFHFPEGQ